MITQEDDINAAIELEPARRVERHEAHLEGSEGSRDAKTEEREQVDGDNDRVRCGERIA